MEREVMSKKLNFKRNTLKLMRVSEHHKPQVLRMDGGRPYIDISTRIIDEAVRCDSCGTYHLVQESENIKFFSLYGNLHANDTGGLLGNGDWDAHGVHVYHFCPECLIDEIRKWTKKKDKQEDVCELR